MRLVLICSFLWFCSPAQAQTLSDSQMMTENFGNVPYMATAASGVVTVTNFADIIQNPLTTFTSTTAASTYTTASITPTANALVIIDVSSTKATAADAPTSIAGNGMSWSQLTNVLCGTSSTNQLTRWIGQTNNTPASGTLVVTFPANQTSCNIQVNEFQGAFVGATAVNAIVASYTNGVTVASANPSINYNTPSAIGTNSLFGAIVDNINSTTDVTAGTNFGVNVKVAHGTANQGLTSFFQMHALSATTTTELATSRAWGMILSEIKPQLELNPTTRPTLVQSAAWLDPDEVGDNYTNHLPNPTLAGNLLAVHVVYVWVSGRSLKLSDDKGNNWTKAQGVQPGDGNSYEEWFATNSISGTTTLYLTVTPTNDNHFHVEFSEWAHIALYQPLDVAGSAAYATMSTPQVGPITTTVDGDLMLTYFLDLEPAAAANLPQQFLNGGGRWLSTQVYYGGMAQAAVQPKASTSHTSIAQPKSLATEHWANTIVTYKRGSGGTLPSTTPRVVHEQWEMIGKNAGGLTNLTAFLPFEGTIMFASDTLWVAAGTNVFNGFPATTWTTVQMNDLNGANMVYTTNQPVRNDPPILGTATVGAPGGTPHALSLWVFYDIAGVTNFDQKVEASNLSNPINMTITAAPSITPNHSPGIIIDEITMSTGPMAFSTIPATQILDGPYYWGATDGSHFNSGTGNLHFLNNNLSTVSFGGSCSNNATTDWHGDAVAFY